MNTDAITMNTSVTPPILQTKKQNDDIRGKMQPIIAKPIMQNSMKIKTRNFKKNFTLIISPFDF